jgi:hypothetical protein
MIQQAGSGAMPFQVGDRVRTAEGLKGEIVLLAKDRVSAYVRIDDGLPGAHAILYRLDKLTKVWVAD